MASLPLVTCSIVSARGRPYCIHVESPRFGRGFRGHSMTLISRDGPHHQSKASGKTPRDKFAAHLSVSDIAWSRSPGSAHRDLLRISNTVWYRPRDAVLGSLGDPHWGRRGIEFFFQNAFFVRMEIGQRGVTGYVQTKQKKWNTETRLA